MLQNAHRTAAPGEKLGYFLFWMNPHFMSAPPPSSPHGTAEVTLRDDIQTYICLLINIAHEHV